MLRPREPPSGPAAGFHSRLRLCRDGCERAGLGVRAAPGRIAAKPPQRRGNGSPGGRPQPRQRGGKAPSRRAFLRRKLLLDSWLRSMFGDRRGGREDSRKRVQWRWVPDLLLPPTTGTSPRSDRGRTASAKQVQFSGPHQTYVGYRASARPRPHQIESQLAGHRTQLGRPCDPKMLNMG